jgi:hypothetical protein
MENPQCVGGLSQCVVQKRTLRRSHFWLCSSIPTTQSTTSGTALEETQHLNLKKTRSRRTIPQLEDSGVKSREHTKTWTRDF